MHNVHRPKPILFQTRWALSFLRGPMTRDQVEELMASYRVQKVQATKKSPPIPIEAMPSKQHDEEFKEQLRRATPAVETPTPTATPSTQPILPSDVPVYLLPVRHTPPVRSIDPALPQFTLEKSTPSPTSSIRPTGEPVARRLIYVARLLGIAEVAFLDKKRALDLRRTYRFLIEPAAPGFPISWSPEIFPDPTPAAEEKDAEWTEVPDGWNSLKKLTTLKKELADHLYREAKFGLYENDALELLGKPGEEILDFLNRCKQIAMRQGESELAKEQDKYEAKVKAERAKVPAEALAPPKIIERSSFADIPIFNWFVKAEPKEKPLAKGVIEKAVQVRQKLADLEEEWERKKLATRAKWEEIAGQYTEVLLKPRKTDVVVSHFGLAWVPYWHCTHEDGTVQRVPAYSA